MSDFHYEYVAAFRGLSGDVFRLGYVVRDREFAQREADEFNDEEPGNTFLAFVARRKITDWEEDDE